MHLATGLVRLGHDITLCCMSKALVETEGLERAGVRIVLLHAENRVQRLAAVPRLIRLARSSEIVHCTIWDASLWGRIAAILARRPVVVADHATDRSIHTSTSGAPRASWIALHNRILDRFTYATVACAVTQREMFLSEGVAAEKIVYIPNGLPVVEIRSLAAQAPSRTALGLPEGVPLIMQVGVFREEKNQLGALEAFAGVRKSGSNAHLVFVGDGRIKPSAEERAEELEADWVHFLGARSDVPALLALADLLIQPSLADAMPMSVLEAMAVGVPVIATAVGDVPAMLEGRAGICVPPNDQPALERAMAELLTDPERRTAMGSAGREIASTRDASAMVQSYENLFQAALEGRAPAGVDRGGWPDPSAHVAT